MVKEKSVHYYLIILFLMIWTTACDTKSSSEQQQESKDNEIEFELVELEDKYSLDSKEDSPSCNLMIKVLYPQSSEKYDLDLLQKQFISSIIGVDYENATITEAIDKYKQNYIDNYRQDAEIYRVTKPKMNGDSDYYEDGEHSNIPDIFYSYYEVITDTIVYNYSGVLSYQVKQKNSKGGTMSHESFKNYAVNLATGEMISEGDIFSAGYDIALRSIIQGLLMVQHDVKSIEELEDLGYFGIEEIIPNKNFLITDQGIIYTYNKGEYSAYPLPASEVLIPYSHIRSILKEGSIADKLSKL